MCESYDVLQSSSGSASDMSHTLNDYGGGMGAGIRKLTEEFFDTGKKIGRHEGYDDGFCDGFSSGCCSGVVKGTIVTTIVVSTVGVAVWGIKKLTDHYHIKKRANISVTLENKQNDSSSFNELYTEENISDGEIPVQFD